MNLLTKIKLRRLVPPGSILFYGAHLHWLENIKLRGPGPLDIGVARGAQRASPPIALQPMKILLPKRLVVFSIRFKFGFWLDRRP